MANKLVDSNDMQSNLARKIATGIVRHIDDLLMKDNKCISNTEGMHLLFTDFGRMIGIQFSPVQNIVTPKIKIELCIISEKATVVHVADSDDNLDDVIIAIGNRWHAEHSLNKHFVKIRSNDEFIEYKRNIISDRNAQKESFHINKRTSRPLVKQNTIEQVKLPSSNALVEQPYDRQTITNVVTVDATPIAKEIVDLMTKFSGMIDKQQTDLTNQLIPILTKLADAGTLKETVTVPSEWEFNIKRDAGGRISSIVAKEQSV